MSALRKEHPEDFPPGGDVRVTQRRREAGRARRQRIQKLSAAGALLFLMLAVGVIRWRAPQAPPLRVNWPNTEKLGAATLKSGSTLVFRAGQPFVVFPVDAKNWDVSWRHSEAKGEGLPIKWPPSGNLDTLEMSCRPRAKGWQRLIAWLWPTRFVSLHGTSAVSLGGGRYVVVPQKGVPVRLSSRVVASHQMSPEARWHESALPLLEEAARRSSSLAPGATWTIVLPPGEMNAQSSTRTLDGKAGDEPAEQTPRDLSTYAVLSPDSFRDPVQALTQSARIIAARAPQIGIKWIARPQAASRQPRALLWLNFNSPKELKNRGRRKSRNGSRQVGARGGWIVRTGSDSGAPVDWWSNSAPTAP